MNRIFPSYFLWFSVAVALAACGGDSDDSDKEVVVTDTEISLSGKTRVTGATVTATNLEGDVLGSVSSSESGAFSFDFTEGQVEQGYKLSVTGGQLNGVDFSDTLYSIYSSEELDNLSVSYVTNVVTTIAESDGGSESLLDKRNQAISLLSGLGMVTSSSWNTLDSGQFSLGAIAIKAEELGGASSWNQQIITDIADGELSEDAMVNFFPDAHTGLRNVSVEDVSINLNETTSFGVDIGSTDSDSLIITLNDAPDWVTVDGSSIVVSPSDSADIGESEISLEVSRSEGIKGRQTNFTISILNQVALVEGSLDSVGGTIENEWRDISITAPDGLLTQPYEVQYLLSMGASGELELGISSVPEMTEDELFGLSVNVPRPAVLRARYGESLVVTPTESRNLLSRDLGEFTLGAGVSIPPSCSEEWNDNGRDSEGNGDGFEFSHILQAKEDYFFRHIVDYGLSGSSLSRPRIVPYLSQRSGYMKFMSCTSLLVAESAEILSEGGDPVLLVHGYANGVMGGVDKYFDAFPKLLKNAGYVPFTFNWNTNMRFEDAANELGNAIKKITSVTNKQVHIVAHSYGGLTTRTLLQGFAEKTNSTSTGMIINPEFTKEFMEKNIATVTTVGTPHSGVFSSESDVVFDGLDSITFPDGRDDNWGNFIFGCNALTCHGAGQAFGYAEYSPAFSEIVGLEQNPGQVVFRLASSFVSNYPNVPTKVLIGLKPDDMDCDSGSPVNNCDLRYTEVEENLGDGLISFQGQRLLPDLAYLKTEMFSSSGSGLNVQEHLLGFRESTLDEDYRYLSIYDAMGEDTIFDDGSLSITRLIEGDYSSGFAEMYHHMSDQGQPLRTISDWRIHDGGATVEHTYMVPLLTEVGMQSCGGAPATCTHATWEYFKEITTSYPSEPVLDEVSLITASGVIEYEEDVSERSVLRARTVDGGLAADTIINIYAGTELVGFTAPNTEGEFSIEVPFEANQSYTAEVVVPASTGYRAKSLAPIVSSDTLEETGVLNFSIIDLILDVFRTADLRVNLKDSSSGIELFNYDLSVKNIAGTGIVNDFNVLDTSSSTLPELPIGEYIVEVTKEGYEGTGIEVCTVYSILGGTCIITLAPEGFVVDGGLSAVLTWGANPSDLDSHLLKYNEGGDLVYQIYFNNRTSGSDSLDLDDTSGFGPETVRISDIDASAVYVYAVKHFSGSGSITTTSEATVDVSLSDGSVRSFSAPTSEDSQTKDLWKVFEIRDGKLLPCVSGCIVSSQSALLSARSSASAVNDLNWVSDIESSVQSK